MLEKRRGILDAHIQHIADGFAAIAHFQRFAVVAATAAFFAGYLHIWQKVHFYHLLACALAGFATPTLYVERETARFIAPYPRLGQGHEQVTDIRENARISSRVAPRRAAYWRLVYLYYLVNILQSLNFIVRERRFFWRGKK
jgi:hypothetical protein